MLNRTANPQEPRPEGVTPRAVEAACAQAGESSKRVKQITERGDVRRKSYEYAKTFWKMLVKNVGTSEAKGIMRDLMGDKKPGRPKTDRDIAMICFIYAYIRHWGLSLSDARIANHIHKSRPHYLILKSGAIAVANIDFTEAYMSSTDDPVVGREPVHLQLAAIKKRVERVRRFAIGEDLLPKEYSPKAYHRDQ